LYGSGFAGLWKSDGRTASLVRYFDNGGPFQLTAANGKLYFVASTRAAGTELWTSDGTTAGTVMVADLAPGPDSSYPSGLELVGRTLFFGANPGLWKLDVPPGVVGRHVFYNHSSFDGYHAAADAADDGAIATDKAALLPGQAATFANVTSFAKGINGVMVDIAGLPEGVALTADDFEIGGNGTPPATVSVRRGAGAGGSDRVTLTWPDYNPLTDPPTMAVGNGWLRVTVKANGRTGLAAPDVFSFGNLIGEVGDSSSAAGWRVNAIDLGAVKRALNASATITGTTDFNRDGRTNALDLGIAKRWLNLTLAPPPAPAGAGGTTSVRSVAREVGIVG